MRLFKIFPSPEYFFPATVPLFTVSQDRFQDLGRAFLPNGFTTSPSFLSFAFQFPLPRWVFSLRSSTAARFSPLPPVSSPPAWLFSFPSTFQCSAIADAGAWRPSSLALGFQTRSNAPSSCLFLFTHPFSSFHNRFPPLALYLPFLLSFVVLLSGTFPQTFLLALLLRIGVLLLSPFFFLSAGFFSPSRPLPSLLGLFQSVFRSNPPPPQTMENFQRFVSFMSPRFPLPSFF